MDISEFQPKWTVIDAQGGILMSFQSFWKVFERRAHICNQQMLAEDIHRWERVTVRGWPRFQRSLRHIGLRYKAFPVSLADGDYMIVAFQNAAHHMPEIEEQRIELIASWMALARLLPNKHASGSRGFGREWYKQSPCHLPHPPRVPMGDPRTRGAV